MMQQEQLEYVLQDKDLIKGLTEKEVEIDHLKTTLVALQQKVEVRSIIFAILVLNICRSLMT